MLILTEHALSAPIAKTSISNKELTEEIYLETAKKGLTSIMAVFPQTMRAISETEELCRLLFPLACLYQVTGEDTHKKWIYDVCERLEIYSHKI